MEASKKFILKLADTYHCQIIEGNDTFFIIKWSWDYQQALAFQLEMVQLVRINREIKIFILCSHPHCFTMGRGLQKGKEVQQAGLIDFDWAQASKLCYPTHQIKRGGGITFHYPGQLIIYPIVNLGHGEFSVKSLINFLAQIVEEVLFKRGGGPLSHDRPLLGIWHKDKKLASIGFALEHFVTYHGLALNVLFDNTIFAELAKINPCGLGVDRYSTVEESFGNLVAFSSNKEKLIPILGDEIIAQIRERIS
ncbi:MAG: hypothetical protein A2504_09740 [Bdellovibrionales bacterium RIFOXYD12_FULL_39_22]|nr:MAG: hypothetical protein A2385_13230 [Bdellovibrionales bacterium RIFOXYB1_FULL_39_21]OFZ41009.1 MAG: hypothetical protein A2485_16740 [Bdellovibrionales bacterium RIFOXYC12_FULL_39_17]OFZ44837.1 MAG: hypothetical protein A2404_10030 [Bdellovibrionales bacterium RIFOXYC1_FULL_39_130]OFZ74302.1 MAG: hypothetical protein A2560_16995 [Bdellovibrionales bacterium RIFOXYD1_FULL_39_84]OFZ92166.1 MAG: hypothetical protein A2504_09740 [Bdellovibrionales bacterium RIFOXYD12_FULL_39_22]HLE12730.1 hy